MEISDGYLWARLQAASGSTLTFPALVKLELTAVPNRLYYILGGSDDGGSTPDAEVQLGLNTLLAAGVPQDNIRWLYTGVAVSTFVIQNARSLSSSENIVLALAGGTFAVADAKSLSSSDNIVLQNAGGGTFVISDAKSLTTSDNVTMILAGGVFAIDDTKSLSSSENITLQNAASLDFVIADAKSLSSSDNVVIVLAGGTLTIADAKSLSSSENVVITEAGDTTAPTVTAATIGVSNLVATGTSVTASDVVGVTGFMIRAISTAPAATSPTLDDGTIVSNGWQSAITSCTATKAAAGTISLYVFAKDAAGNVSTAFTVAGVAFTAGLKTVSDPFTGTNGDLISVAQPLWVSSVIPTGVYPIPKTTGTRLLYTYSGAAIWNDTFAPKQFAQIDIDSLYDAFADLILRASSGGLYRFVIQLNADPYEAGEKRQYVSIYNYNSSGTPTITTPVDWSAYFGTVTKIRVKVDENYIFTIEGYVGAWYTLWTGFSAGANHASGTIGLVTGYFAATGGDNFSGGEW
jgi:hypothetical protein